VASLDHEVELLARVDALVGERDRVVAGLAEGGWSVPQPQGNFVWFALGDRTAAFVAAAEAAGIMVRPFAGEGVRVTIGEPEANDVLLGVAAAFGQLS
jgi:histidinol-phosphate aminotransferase